jgi:hypothetical protein
MPRVAVLKQREGFKIQAIHSTLRFVLLNRSMTLRCFFLWGEDFFRENFTAAGRRGYGRSSKLYRGGTPRIGIGCRTAGGRAITDLLLRMRFCAWTDFQS